MSNYIPPVNEAREARTKLLSRARWIVDANVLAACGYSPQLPPDLVDFDRVRDMDPCPKALASLLKGVMPVIKLSEDRSIMSYVPEGATPVEEAKAVMNACYKGFLSGAEANTHVQAIGRAMEFDERRALLDFIKETQKAGLKPKF